MKTKTLFSALFIILAVSLFVFKNNSSKTTAFIANMEYFQGINKTARERLITDIDIRKAAELLGYENLTVLYTEIIDLREQIILATNIDKPINHKDAQALLEQVLDWWDAIIEKKATNNLILFSGLCFIFCESQSFKATAPKPNKP